MILTGAILHGETPGESLHVLWPRRWWRVEFTRLGLRLGSRDIFRSREGQEVSGFGGVDEYFGTYADASTVLLFNNDRLNMISMHLGGQWAGASPDLQAPRRDIAGKHLLECGERDPRFMTESGN
jgi:hypothetical protein